MCAGPDPAHPWVYNLFIVIVTEDRMHVLDDAFLLGYIKVCPFAGNALLKNSGDSRGRGA